MTDTRPSLEELEAKADFARRHIGPDDADCAEMLEALELTSLDHLVADTVPSSIRDDTPLALPAALSETEALAELRAMAEKNKVATSMLGLGYHDTIMPPVVLRNVLENPAWYTAYTPYQAEVSQGRLEALLNYQQMIMDLTGMELANASLLDEATAAAEAMTMARRIAKSKGEVFFVDVDCLPQTIAVVKTRAAALGIEVVVGDPWKQLAEHEAFGVLIQYPGADGALRDPQPVIEAAHAQKAFAIVAADLLSLALITPPGEMGADVVLGSAQRFGVPLGYGGPHAAYFATLESHKRSTPGRIIGVSVDSAGRPALRMALQTREQHIRREKATSNICTAQVLLAVIAGFYAVYHGPEGIRRIAQRVHRMAAILADGLRRLGFTVETEHFFDSFVVKAPGEALKIAERLRTEGINLRSVEGERFAIACDEATTRETVEAIWAAFAGGKEDAISSVVEIDLVAADPLPDGLKRSSDYLTHPVFNVYRS